MDFTKNFNFILKNEKINQTELAKKLNVTKQAITNLKKGSSLPSLDLLCAIAIELEVTTDFLLGIESINGRKNYTVNTSVHNNFGNINFNNK